MLPARGGGPVVSAQPCFRPALFPASLVFTLAHFTFI
jgi:hypothetical protein